MTRTTIIAAVAGALVTVPTIAWACGGGGGDSGGSSGDSGGGDSSSSSDSGSYSSTPACVDTTDVHGHRECTDFGSWRARRVAVAVELGPVSSLVDLRNVSASGTITHDAGQSYSYRVVGEDFGADLHSAHGLALRTLVHGRHLYGGLESSFQVLDGGDRLLLMEDGATLSPRITGASKTMLVVGARRFADQILGPLAPRGVSAGAELGAGANLLAIESESRREYCVTTDTAVAATAVVEARARVDVWLSPHVSLGAWGGTDLLSRTPSAGLVLSSHFRPFDGTR